MNEQSKGIRPLYFILAVLFSLLITSLLAPEHTNNVYQHVLFTAGMLILIVGTAWRLTQKWNKVSQKKGTAVQAIGTSIAVLTALSGIIW